jgi:hypothetical protein
MKLFRKNEIKDLEIFELKQKLESLQAIGYRLSTDYITKIDGKSFNEIQTTISSWDLKIEFICNREEWESWRGKVDNGTHYELIHESKDEMLFKGKGILIDATLVSLDARPVKVILTFDLQP